MAIRGSPIRRDSGLTNESSGLSPDADAKREERNRSPDDLVIEEKMEKESSGSSSGFEELSPNAQSVESSRSPERPDSKQAQKVTDISMKISNDVSAPNSVINISIEINGVMFRGALESQVKQEQKHEKAE